jgi:hypothetical protein
VQARLAREPAARALGARQQQLKDAAALLTRAEAEALAAARLARPAAPAPGLVLLADALLATAKTLKAAAMLDLAVEVPPRNRTCAPRPEIEHARRAPGVWPVSWGGSAARRPLLPRALTPSQSAGPPRAPRGRPAHAHRGAAAAARAVCARAAAGDSRLSRGRNPSAPTPDQPPESGGSAPAPRAANNPRCCRQISGRDAAPVRDFLDPLNSLPNRGQARPRAPALPRPHPLAVARVALLRGARALAFLLYIFFSARALAFLLYIFFIARPPLRGRARFGV